MLLGASYKVYVYIYICSLAMEVVLLLSENFRPIYLTKFIEHNACRMRVADGTDIFRPVYPTSYASPLFPHSETNFQFDFIHKTFYLFPQYKRHKVGFHCVGLRVTSYDVPRGRNESSLKHDKGSFHKCVHIKRPSLQRILDSSVSIVMRLRAISQRNRGSIASRSNTFISSCPDRLSAYTASYPVDNVYSFPRGKTAWAWSWQFTPSSVEVKKKYLHFPIYLHGAYRGNLAFMLFPFRVQILGNSLNISLDNDSRLYSTKLSCNRPFITRNTQRSLRSTV